MRTLPPVSHLIPLAMNTAPDSHPTTRRVLGRLTIQDSAKEDANAEAVLGPERNLTAGLSGPTGSTVLGTDPRRADQLNWSYRDFDRKDPLTLLALKREQPEIFRQLFVAHYGSEPKGLNLTAPLTQPVGTLNAVTTAHLNAPERQGWNIRKWETDAPNELAAMRSHDPDRYEALFTAHYGPKRR